MDNSNSWSDPLQQRLKLERNLNFSNLPLEDEDLINFAKKKTSRDPTSHRIIEKRRRDRMNNCLADLSRLIPSSYMKKARGRIEKTEIIEMAIRHLKHLQGHACKQIDKCEVALRVGLTTNSSEQFHLGYQECMSEAMHFLVEVEGFYAADTLCVRLLNHLQKHCDKISRVHDVVGSSSGSSCHSRNSGSTSSQSGDGLKEALNVLDISQHSISDCGHMENMSANGDDDHMELTCDTTSCIANETDAKIFEASQSPDQSSSLGRGHQPQERSYLQLNEVGCITKTDEVYKFKTNIKQRFHADLKQNKHEVNERDDDSDTINGTAPSTTDEYCGVANMPQLEPSYQISSSVTEMQTKTNEDHQYKILDQVTIKPECSTPRPKSDNVPMFVLHPKSSYYLPMTIDAAIIAPLINCADADAPALHPVSIAVYFGNATPTIHNLTKPTSSSSISPWYSSDLEASSLSDPRFLLATSRA